MENKTIYSKRYGSTEPSESLHPSGRIDLENVVQQSREEVIFVEREGRVNLSKHFIAQCISFSEGYPLDLDILQTECGYDAIFTVPALLYEEDFCTVLSYLLRCSDHIEICPSTREPCLTSIRLRFYTHRCYMGGHQIMT